VSIENIDILKKNIHMIIEFLTKEKIEQFNEISSFFLNLGEDVLEEEFGLNVEKYLEYCTPIDFSILFTAYNSFAVLLKKYSEYLSIKVRSDILTYVKNEEDKKKLINDLDNFLENKVINIVTIENSNKIH
jgi:hypothetical protein